MYVYLWICMCFSSYIYPLICIYVCMFMQLCPTLATPRTIAHQASLSMGFCKQEYRSGLPFPTPGNLPDPGTKPVYLASSARFFTTESPGKLPSIFYLYLTNQIPKSIYLCLLVSSQFLNQYKDDKRHTCTRVHTHTHTHTQKKNKTKSKHSACMCAHSLQSRLALCDPMWLFVIPWTIAHQAPQSMGFSWQEYQSGLPCSPATDLPNSRIKPVFPASSATKADSLPLSHWGSPKTHQIAQIKLEG